MSLLEDLTYRMILSVLCCLCRSRGAAKIGHANGNTCQSDTGCLPSKAFADTDQQPTTWDRENRKPSWSPHAGYCSEPFWIYQHSLRAELCQYAQLRRMQPGCCRWFPCFRSNLHVEGAVPKRWSCQATSNRSLPAPTANRVVEHWNSTGFKKRERESSIEDAQVSKLVLKQPNNLGLLLGL